MDPPPIYVFPLTGQENCTLVYLAPDISIAPNNQTLPIPLTHNWPRWAIQFIPLLISLGIAAGIRTGTAGLSLNDYQSLSKDLTDSLEEIATSFITIQNQLDSLATIVLQNRRGLDLLTAEKGDLCLFLEEACCFYANKSGFVKEAARSLTNRASRIHQHLSNSWENWLSDWNWMPWVPPFLGPLLLLTLILSFWPCSMHLFFKNSSGPLTSLHQLNYPWATSNSLRLSKTSTPHKSPWPTFQPFLFSPPWSPCPSGSSYRRLTFGPYPKSKRLEW